MEDPCINDTTMGNFAYTPSPYDKAILRQYLLDVETNELSGMICLPNPRKRHSYLDEDFQEED